MKKFIQFSLLSAVITIFIQGCATPAQTQSMAVPTESIKVVANPIGDQLNIVVSGGRDTLATGYSSIANEDFAASLKQSLKDSGLFYNIHLLSNEEQDHTLQVYIARIQQPAIGFSFTVHLEVNYRLTDNRNGETVLQEVILSEYTASAGDAFAGVTRLRLATEGAARENIRKLIDRLAVH